MNDKLSLPQLSRSERMFIYSCKQQGVATVFLQLTQWKVIGPGAASLWIPSHRHQVLPVVSAGREARLHSNSWLSFPAQMS